MSITKSTIQVAHTGGIVPGRPAPCRLHIRIRSVEPSHVLVRVRVSEVLNGDRNPTLPMIKRLHEGLDIPCEGLIR
ncbi:MAG: hypothetical protein OXB98_07625 [Bryobacterales bacterium]|nr:hypothetical protein [Bryobacterales bacterium]